MVLATRYVVGRLLILPTSSQALQANPAAFVSIKNLALRNHHHHLEDRYDDEDGETQKEDGYIDDGNDDEDDDWEGARHQRREGRRYLARRCLNVNKFHTLKFCKIC